MKDFPELPKLLRDLRVQYNFTQKYIAEKLGITYQSYQSYEHGKTLPTLKSLVILAKLYDVSADYLLGIEEI